MGSLQQCKAKGCAARGKLSGNTFLGSLHDSTLHHGCSKASHLPSSCFGIPQPFPFPATLLPDNPVLSLHRGSRALLRMKHSCQKHTRICAPSPLLCQSSLCLPPPAAGLAALFPGWHSLPCPATACCCASSTNHFPPLAGLWQLLPSSKRDTAAHGPILRGSAPSCGQSHCPSHHTMAKVCPCPTGTVAQQLNKAESGASICSLQCREETQSPALAEGFLSHR